MIEEREFENALVESERQRDKRRRLELAWEWLRYHNRMRRNGRRMFKILDAHHAQEIEKYERILGLDEGEKGAA